VTIDNLPRQKTSVAKRPTVSLGGPFLAQGDELNATLDPKNYSRYEPMIDAVRKLDMQRVADVYLRFYPLFQSAYQDLGYPNAYFNDRLVAVIDSLLAAPEPAGPIELTRPNVMYTFSDPTLEALPAGQKLLIRMGPDNAGVIKAKLRELRSIVSAGRPGAASSTGTPVASNTDRSTAAMLSPAGDSTAWLAYICFTEPPVSHTVTLYEFKAASLQYAAFNR